MIKEQIIEVIENSFNEYKGSNEAIDNAAFYIAAEFEKKEKEVMDFSKFALWYYNDSLYSKTITWEELKKIHELFKKEKNV